MTMERAIRQTRFRTLSRALSAGLLLTLTLGGCASLFFHPSKERYAIPDLEKAAPEDVW
jgi:hypothetical protein